MLNFLNEIKYFYQRGKRGYSDRDLWSVHEYMSEVFPAMVRNLKGDKVGHGHPSMARSQEEWDVILEQIAEGFKAHSLLDSEWVAFSAGELTSLNSSEQIARRNEADRKLSVACELLKVYYCALWS